MGNNLENIYRSIQRYCAKCEKNNYCTMLCEACKKNAKNETGE